MIRLLGVIEEYYCDVFFWLIVIFKWIKFIGFIIVKVEGCYGKGFIMLKESVFSWSKLVKVFIFFGIWFLIENKLVGE